MGAACVNRREAGDENQEEDKHLVETLKQQVEALRRRNAALEQALTPSSARGGLEALRQHLGNAAPGGTSPRRGTLLSEVGGLHAYAGALPSSPPVLRRRPASGVVGSGVQRGLVHSASNISAHERSRLLQEAARQAEAAIPLPFGLLFPNQTPNMFGTLQSVDKNPLVQKMMASASAVLELNVQELCQRGPPEKLQSMRLAQPIVYIASCIALELLRCEQPDAVNRCQAVAGIGVGEFAALYAADVWDFELGLRLVMIRAEQMQKVADAEGAQMQQLTVTGMSLERVRSLCDQVLHKCGPGEVCSVAYAVGAKAHIATGTLEAIQLLQTLASSQSGIEVKASYVERPKGGNFCAFQTKLMEEAKDYLKRALYETLPILRPPRCPVYFNVMGEALPAGASPTLIVELLSEQLTSTVLWEATARTMAREGVNEMIMCGPTGSSQLGRIVQQNRSQARTRMFLV